MAADFQSAKGCQTLQEDEEEVKEVDDEVVGNENEFDISTHLS